MRKRAKLKTIPWDTTQYLKTDEDIAGYLEAAFEDGDPALSGHVLGNVVRAKGAARIARTAGLDRKTLVHMLSTQGNPDYATVLKVIRALGLKLKVAA